MCRARAGLRRKPPRRCLKRRNSPAYTETIPGSTITFEMVAIPGGSFMMGSPDSEAGRKEDEGPVHKVTLEPFLDGKDRGDLG